MTGDSEPSLGDYKRLLGWTGSSVGEIATKVPTPLAKLLGSIGIEASMWRELVWDWQRYFGRCSCALASESMRAEAERTGHRFHRGQASAADCFA